MHISLGLVSLENVSSVASTEEILIPGRRNIYQFDRSVTNRESTSEVWIEIMALQANTLAV